LTRYLLDTNVVSNLTKPLPSDALLGWLADQNEKDLYVSTISIAEVWRGILQMPRGRKRRDLEEWFEGADGPSAFFAGRVLTFDLEAALIWARLMAEGATVGRPRGPFDMTIAAIALAHDLVVVTGNERHFRGVVELINPMQS
jgi:predicted nucleic acid-binding protein